MVSLQKSLFEDLVQALDDESLVAGAEYEVLDECQTIMLFGEHAATISWDMDEYAVEVRDQDGEWQEVYVSDEAASAVAVAVRAVCRGMNAFDSSR